MTALLEGRGLSFSYDDRPVFSHVDIRHGSGSKLHLLAKSIRSQLPLFAKSIQCRRPDQLNVEQEVQGFVYGCLGHVQKH